MRTMNKMNLVLRLMFVTALFLRSSSVFSAETAATATHLTLAPARYVEIDGDVEKFQLHHWMPEEYSGGVDHFDFQGEIKKNVNLTMEGHALFDANDYSARVRLEDPDHWYAFLHYEEFRKYYDTTGGFYHPFNVLDHIELGRDLSLDIGELEVGAGVQPENLPDVDFLYEHEFRKGQKSRTTWTAVVENGVTKNIGPSWQEMDETADIFELKLSDTFKKFDWFAHQKWEFVDIDSTRHEKNIGTTAAQNKQRRHVQEPSADVIETKLGVERWFKKDKVFISNNYRFSQIENKEVESIFETNQDGVLTNFSNPKAARDALATNQFVSHTWVGHLLWIINPALNLNNRLKVNDIKHTGSSTYTLDASPNAAGGAAPDGVIDQMDISEIDDQIRTWGHSASLRFSGIDRVALYADWDYNQTRNELVEDRQSASSGEVFNRESISHMYRGVGTLGAQYTPCHFINLTSQYRHREDDIRYNNVRYSLPGATAARSVFVDGQYIESDEASARILLRPFTWFEPGFRYQFLNKDYEAWGIPNDQIRQLSTLEGNIYTVDAALRPGDDWLATVAFSFQDSSLKSPAALNTTSAQSPAFNADVYSWLATSAYTVNEKLIVDGYLEFSRAANFNDFASLGGIPFGVEYKELNVGLGAKWSPNKTWVFEPRYDYFHYRPNENAEFGQYDAHVVYFKVSVEWA